MTAGVACKSTVHFSTSFSTTRTSFRKNELCSLAELASLGFAISLITSASVALSACLLALFFTHSPVGRLHKQTTILMRETPQISIVPINDGDRCSILLTIAERLAINSPSTYAPDSPSKHRVSKIDHSCALVLRHYLSCNEKRTQPKASARCTLSNLRCCSGKEVRA
jgi:hypothetical protein